MGAFHTNNLMMRDGIFYFRKATPSSLMRLYRKPEIKKSLKTRDPKRAKWLCRELSSFVDNLPTLLVSISIMDEEEAEHIVSELVREYFEDYLSEINLTWHHFDDLPDEQKSVELNVTINDIPKLRNKASQRSFDVYENNAADDLLNQFSEKKIRENERLRKQLLHGIVRAKLEANIIYLARMESRFGDARTKDPLFDDCDINRMPPVPAVKGEEEHAVTNSVQYYIDAFLELKKPTWSYKTLMEYQRVLRWFSEFGYRNKNIRFISSKDIITFRNALLKMPPNASKDQSFSGKSMRYNARHNKGATLSGKTIDKYYGQLTSFFLWCEGEGHINRSPMPKTSIKKLVKKKNPKEAKLPFNKQWLNDFFQTPIYTGFQSKRSRHSGGEHLEKDSMYWVPLVSLYSGMRPSETVQLFKEDIRLDGDTYYFDVNTERGKSVKVEESSPRAVPIHRVLIDLGFLTYVDSLKRGQRVFWQETINKIQPCNGYPNQCMRREYFHTHTCVEILVISLHSPEIELALPMLSSVPLMNSLNRVTYDVCPKRTWSSIKKAVKRISS